MKKQTEIDQNEDVVVIEERDRRCYVYITIAAVLGLAVGGLVGSSMAASKWESAYDDMEQQYDTLATDKKNLIDEVEVRLASVDAEVKDKFDQAMEKQQQKHDEEIEALNAQVAELEKAKSSLEKQINTQKKTIVATEKTNSKLNRQADIQATMLEHSKELFQKELKVKTELEALENEREELLPKIKLLKVNCDAYLDGTSWDAKSDSCDKLDEANSRLSQVNQMIKVHQMDLKQMKELSEELGL